MLAWIICLLFLAAPIAALRQRGNETPMPTFEIKYIKKLCGDSGHEHEACQSVTTVEAPTADEALRLAEAQVCGCRQLSDWTIFADAIELRATSPLGHTAQG
jgi:hypothetical protein